MRLAISLTNNALKASHYDAETGDCEIVQFDAKNHLGMHFRINAGTPEWVDADEATLQLHAGIDELTTSGQETGVSIEDLLRVVFERVAATVSDVSVVVFLTHNASEPAVFKAAAVHAGFAEAEIRFISPVDAVIRNWQWVAPEQANAARDVVCLTFHENSLTWDRRIAAEDGTFILPDDRTASGCFSPTTDGDHSGLEVFFNWCEKTGGTRYVVVSGADTTTLPPEIVSALEHHYEVVYCDALSGAASPPYPTRYARFDEAILGAIAAVSRSDFRRATEKYEIAKAVFFKTDPPSELEQLRIRIRQELLKAAAHADLDSDEADTYFEWAIGLSNHLKEKAEVHATAANFYLKAGKRQRAEEEMLFASYLDETYAENQETSETPPNGTTQSDNDRLWMWLGLGTGIWFISRHLF